MFQFIGRLHSHHTLNQIHLGKFSLKKIPGVYKVEGLIIEGF